MKANKEAIATLLEQTEAHLRRAQNEFERDGTDLHRVLAEIGLAQVLLVKAQAQASSISIDALRRAVEQQGVGPERDQ